ncbi:MULTISPECIES: hypothetical protein [Microbacterium]|jgi:hypothetical protein|uniref:Uncharacterized protein n=1 Tax=Microbacterium algeriense TaxID=2615184 RepID=A0ABQ6V9L7_9MICO|nr:MULTISPECIES: hypothetical protein [Microbacterium]AZH77318.1 hypothetical protein CSX12_02045 [Microbacterium sp. Y-01]KAB1862647.1 hypothetical protein F6A08_16730 [Microbacterium algeriense]MDX2399171.1 hypothetical protein [Microbacterium algeriense]
MYEHPYLSQQLTRFEQEELERAAARRLFLAEHADQIVPRPAGALRRMLQRLFARPAARRTGAREAGASARITVDRSARPCDTAAVSAR